MKAYFISLLFVSCLLSQLFAKAQTNNKATTKIIGNIEGLKDTTIAMRIPILDSPTVYTIKVSNGKFEWSGSVSQPERVFIFMKEHYMRFFIDTGNSIITIKGNESDISNAVISGSKPQDEYEVYQNEFKGNKKDFIQKYSSSIVSLSIIEDLCRRSADFYTIDSFCKMLSVSSQRTNAYERIRKSMRVLKRSAIGQPFIDFEQKDTSGHLIKLSDFKGKYVLLEFWASWCGPCRAENPNILSTYNAYKNQGLTIVAVSLDDSLDKWKEAIQKDNMPWGQVSDLKGFKNSVAINYGIHSIPFNFLINPDGIIVAKGLRDTALKNKLAEIFKGKTSTKISDHSQN